MPLRSPFVRYRDKHIVTWLVDGPLVGQQAAFQDFRCHDFAYVDEYRSYRMQTYALFVIRNDMFLRTWLDLGFHEEPPETLGETGFLRYKEVWTQDIGFYNEEKHDHYLRRTPYHGPDVLLDFDEWFRERALGRGLCPKECQPDLDACRKFTEDIASMLTLVRDGEMIQSYEIWPTSRRRRYLHQPIHENQMCG